MNVTSLGQYQPPDYPTRGLIDGHPELLYLVPRRWRANPTVLAALGTACVLLSGCGSKKSSHFVPSRVAPIFKHGDGQGVFGCVAANPPVFLSEADARQVISDEAKKEGILFVEDKQILPKVTVQSTDTWDSSRRWTKVLRANKTHKEELVLDGTEAKRKIAYEFVSGDDFDSWEDRSLTSKVCNVIDPGSSVSSTDILKSAAIFREGLVKAKPSGYYAVFYEPLARSPMNSTSSSNSKAAMSIEGEIKAEKAERAARYALGKKLSEEQLRLQVRDFIKWLKAEGVI